MGASKTGCSIPSVPVSLFRMAITLLGDRSRIRTDAVHLDNGVGRNAQPLGGSVDHRGIRGFVQAIGLSLIILVPIGRQTGGATCLVLAALTQYRTVWFRP